MNYDKAELRKIAIIMLEKCQDDLKENGSLLCDAVALDGNGSGYLIPLRFYTVEEKYEVQAGLKEILRAIDARAVVMMCEVWISDTVPTEGTPGYTGSIKDIPGRREAILVNALSASTQFRINQVFTKNGSEVTFQDPIETDLPGGRDDWLDGVWN